MKRLKSFADGRYELIEIGGKYDILRWDAVKALQIIKDLKLRERELKEYSIMNSGYVSCTEKEDAEYATLPVQKLHEVLYPQNIRLKQLNDYVAIQFMDRTGDDRIGLLPQSRISDVVQLSGLILDAFFEQGKDIQWINPIY